MSQKKTLSKIKQQFKQIHGNKYDYSKVSYNGAHSKVTIICPKHGDFQQSPHEHLRGQGCPMCRKEKLSKRFCDTKENFVQKCHKVHGDKYDYSNVNYVNSKTEIVITCPIHGNFKQLPNSHIMGHGCPKCANEEKTKKQLCSLEDFVNKAKKIHGEYYDYSKANYVNSKQKITIICPKHGEFSQTPNDHIQGSGCSKCSHIHSHAEEEIANLIKPLGIKQNNKTILEGKELDIYVPSLKLAIEYNGLLWHSEKYGKDKTYHLSKLEECEKKGIRLIQMFEDEWLLNKEICKQRILTICGLNEKPKLNIDELKTQKIDNKKEVENFISKNDIHVLSPYKIAIVCLKGQEIIGIMTFKKFKKGFWKICNLTTNLSYNVEYKIYQKLFDFFIENYDVYEIELLLDRRWRFDKEINAILKLGFNADKKVPPSCTYYNSRKDKLKRFEKKEISKLTEKEQNNYTKIWDCGKLKYIWKNNGK